VSRIDPDGSARLEKRREEKREMAFGSKCCAQIVTIKAQRSDSSPPINSARYLEEQSVPEWKRAYINYRGMKKLIKRVHEHRSKRLDLQLQRMGSKASNSSFRNPSGFSLGGNGNGENVRRRGTFSSMTRRLTGEVDPVEDRERENVVDGETNNYNTFVSSRRNGNGNGQSRNPGDMAKEVEEEIPPVSLMGTGLKLHNDPLKPAEDLLEEGTQDIKKKLTGIQVLAGITSKLSSGHSSAADGDGQGGQLQDQVRTSDPGPSTRKNPSSGTWNSTTPTTFIKDLEAEAVVEGNHPKPQVTHSDEVAALDSDETNVEPDSEKRNSQKTKLNFAGVEESSPAAHLSSPASPRDEGQSPNSKKKGVGNGNRSGSDRKLGGKGSVKGSKKKGGEF